MDQDDKKRKAYIKNVFNTVAKEYGLGSSYFFHHSGEIMAESLGLTGTESVLDVAAGTGATALPLARKLPKGKVTAVDMSTGMLKQAEVFAQKENLNNIIFSENDMTQLPFGKNSFDHATCAFGLFFITDMGATLQHIANTVKPGGKVLISGFSGTSFQPMAKLCLDRLRSSGVDIPEKIGWQRMSEKHQLQDIFAHAGLKNLAIKKQSIGYYISLDGWWDIIWSAGFRGFVEQLGDKIEPFKQAHFEELQPFCSDKGLWLEIDVNYSTGIK